MIKDKVLGRIDTLQLTLSVTLPDIVLKKIPFLTQLNKFFYTIFGMPRIVEILKIWKLGLVPQHWYLTTSGQRTNKQ